MKRLASERNDMRLATYKGAGSQSSIPYATDIVELRDSAHSFLLGPVRLKQRTRPQVRGLDVWESWVWSLSDQTTRCQYTKTPNLDKPFTTCLTALLPEQSINPIA